MTELQERVARAMCADIGYEWGKGLLMPEDYLGMAEAAIKAMREPTAGMIEVGDVACGRPDV